jgi:hypothetical protein
VAAGVNLLADRAILSKTRNHGQLVNARCSTDYGIVRPSALAVLRLITS